ncbi:MAG: GGDEF domain-containing protein, partial [Bacillota bacterium]
MDFFGEDPIKASARIDEPAILKGGEFANPRLEEEYFALEFDEALEHVRPLVLALATLYVLFAIPDYLLNPAPASRWFMGITRIVVAAAAFAFYLCIARSQCRPDARLWFSVLEILAGTSFVLIFSRYETPDLLIHTLGAIVMIMIIFIMPNRWINRVVIASGLGTAFVLAAVAHRADFPAGEFSASAVYLAVVIVLNAATSYTLAVARRREFLARRDLFRAATLDSLTGVYNRNKFNEELDSGIRYARRYNTPLTLSILDLDDFKKVNDRLGHLEGDRVLRQLATSVRNAVRDTDV